MCVYVVYIYTYVHVYICIYAYTYTYVYTYSWFVLKNNLAVVILTKPDASVFEKVILFIYSMWSMHVIMLVKAHCEARKDLRHHPVLCSTLLPGTGSLTKAEVCPFS